MTTREYNLSDTAPTSSVYGPEEVHGINILDWGVIALYVIFISWLRWNLTGLMRSMIMARVLSAWDRQGNATGAQPHRLAGRL